MVLEFLSPLLNIFGGLFEFAGSNFWILLAVALVFFFVVFKIFAHLLRAIIAGIVFIAAGYGLFSFGMLQTFDINRIFWLFSYGFAFYSVYSLLLMGFRIFDFILWPFKKLLGGGRKKPRQEKGYVKLGKDED